MQGKPVRILTRSMADLMTPITQKALDYAALIAELNDLDHVCKYTRRRLDARIRVTYDTHDWLITREEAKEQLQFLRKLHGQGEKHEDPSD